MHRSIKIGEISRKLREAIVHNNPTWDPSHYNDSAIGPMGLHDAYLLDAICRYIRPKVALEYGGLLGHSLSVMAPYCGRVISVDNIAHQSMYDAASRYNNVHIVKGDMRLYDPKTNNMDEINLVLFDASHLCTDYIKAYQNIKSILSSKSLILVHDTSDWFKGVLPTQWEWFKEEREILTQQDRKFVVYLREEGYNDITFESDEHLRHGYTVLKKCNW